MNKNVCIVHFNTPVLTAHLVKSINKHTPDTNIYIFDNSDKKPFVNSFNNVTVFDNTKGQIINFNEWLKKYPRKNRSGGKTNKWGSAKHAYSVEKCMELINEPFVLLDSDVLVKKDFTPLYDEIVCYKGEVVYQPNSKVKRVLPFICFINTPMCKKNGIHYFDENYMHGLSVGPTGDRYDTGAAIYLLTEKKKAPHREIKVEDYIVHYGNGSWVDAAEKIRKPKHIPAMDWLNKYKNFWSGQNDGESVKNISFCDVFDHIYCLHYLPDSSRLDKLKNELIHAGIDETADYFTWVYDYPTQLIDIMYNNKNVNMSTALKSSSREYIKRVSLKHYEIIKEAYSLGYGKILILENDVRFHRDREYIEKMLSNIPNTDVVMFDKMVTSSPGDGIKYKNYVKSLPDGALYGGMNESGLFFIFCSCYGLNRNAMKQIIEEQEKNLLPPDTPLNDKKLTGSFAIINLAIQDPELKTRKVEDYNKIGLNTTLYGPVKESERTVKATIKQVVAKPNSTHKIEQNTRHKVSIKVPIKHHEKTNMPKPESSKKPVVRNRNKMHRIRVISAKATGFNKLYDV